MLSTTAVRLSAALLVLTAGCATDSAQTAEDTSTTSDGLVEVVDFVFTPGRLTVAAGSDVTWTNRDSFAHTVTSGTREALEGTFDAPLGEPQTHDAKGASFTATFEEPGIYPYFCALHTSMSGTIVVTSP